MRLGRQQFAVRWLTRLWVGVCVPIPISTTPGTHGAMVAWMGGYTAWIHRERRLEKYSHGLTPEGADAAAARATSWR